MGRKVGKFVHKITSLLLLFNSIFGFDGMIWAQPVTEVIMMTASVFLLYTIIRKEQKAQNLSSDN